MAVDFMQENLNGFQKFCCRILQAGPVPRHVAFIMDGNRRYARRMGLKSVCDGHSSGFDTLSKTLNSCREVGIREATVYAFSIENFKRSDNEVAGLMDLARQKLGSILDQMTKVEENGVRFCFFGNLDLMPADIQQLIATITLKSVNNSKFQLNICIAYTSHDEMKRALAELERAVASEMLLESDIDEHLISQVLDTRLSSDPDLLIRTSGEHRFSDFLLYQTAYSCLYFDDVLWPNYTFWHLFRAILYYQSHYNEIEKRKIIVKCSTMQNEDQPKKTRTQTFLQTFRQKYVQHLKKLANDVF